VEGVSGKYFDNCRCVVSGGFGQSFDSFGGLIGVDTGVAAQRPQTIPLWGCIHAERRPQPATPTLPAFPRRLHPPPTRPISSNPASYDTDVARRLYEVSQELVAAAVGSAAVA
jgi:hypothetical protein